MIQTLVWGIEIKMRKKNYYISFNHESGQVFDFMQPFSHSQFD